MLFDDITPQHACSSSVLLAATFLSPSLSPPSPFLSFPLLSSPLLSSPLLSIAMAGLHLWPSLHVALSNASVFIDYSTERNDTVECNTTLSLVDTETNTTVLTRNLPSNQSEGRVEFNCSCFLYAGTFRFRLEQTRYVIVHNTNGSDTGSRKVATLWWSPELKVEWPTIHIAVERSSNQSGSFQVGKEYSIAKFCTFLFRPMTFLPSPSLPSPGRYLHQ